MEYQEGDKSNEYYFTSFVGSLVLSKRGKKPSLKNYRLYDEKVREIDVPIVVMTNDEIKFEEFKKIFEELEKTLKRRPWFFYSASKEILERKPCPQMFEKFEELSGYQRNENTLFIGNLVGRILTDNSFEDLHFADNLGIKISTPNEYFDGKKFIRPYESFTPLNCITDEMETLKIPDDIKLLLIRGRRGCGKTFYCDNYLPDFIRLSKDEIGFVECEKQTKKILREGGKVVLDKIHPGLSSWHYSLEIALKMNIKIGILTINTPDVVLKHLRYYRYLTEGGKLFNNRIDSSYFSKEESPCFRDGFSFIKEIEWHSHLNKIGHWYF